MTTFLTNMKKWSLTPLHPPLLLICLFSLLSLSVSRDNITTDSALAYTDTLESPDSTFTLGFFTRGTNRSYLGIWYTKDEKTIVWVANRDKPMHDTTGVLSVSTNGLQLQTTSGQVFWTSEMIPNMVTPVAQLLGIGNFVLKDLNTNNIVWQSFDYPTDTLLPGMTFGWVGGQNHYLTSWSSSDDPSSSKYTIMLVQSAWMELIISNGFEQIFRTGPWNMVDQFSGVKDFIEDNDLMFEYVTNQNDRYIKMIGDSRSRIVLNNSYFQRYLQDGSVWQQHWSVPSDHCDDYNKCGPYGVCHLISSNNPNCTCLETFVPTYELEWAKNETEDGCQNKVALSYTEKDGFLQIQNVKLPDTENVTVDSTIGLKECKKWCLMNSSCTAYSNLNGTSGCAIWMYSLTDMRQLDGGSTLYYRVAASEVPDTATSMTGKKAAVIVVSVTIGFLILASAAYFIRNKFVNRNRNLESSETQSQISKASSQPIAMSGNETQKEESPKGSIFNIPIFDASVISEATKDFALSNKLGEGGFGTVFEGKLEGGKRVAVKRLKYSSTEGLSEFRNEVMLIAELQHVNLVRLLGYCIDEGKRMLIYEYMENRSLDTFLFDKQKSSQLDWEKRFNVITGIARGILYLHQDSRLRIIHRDLKASNILLDENMSPKISDFGIARIFGRHDKDSVTSRVIGTYGYMSPEYALYGAFSVKSDVYSFGVLILEIVSGKKISKIFSTQPLLNLLSFAWALWNEDKALKLLDASIPKNSINKPQIVRCIQVGLCCVQDNPEDRPHISEAILMLNSPNAIVPQPKQPAHFSNRALINMESSSSGSVLDTDITAVEAR